MGKNAIRAQKDANDIPTTGPRKRGSSPDADPIVWGLFAPLPWAYMPFLINAITNDGATLTFQFVTVDDSKLSSVIELPLDDTHGPFAGLPNIIPKQKDIDAGESVGVLMINSAERPRSMSTVKWKAMIDELSTGTFDTILEKWPRGAEHIKNIKDLVRIANVFLGKVDVSHSHDPVLAKAITEFRALESALR